MKDGQPDRDRKRGRERGRDREVAIGAASCCEARAYAFAKRADRITRYYDRSSLVTSASRDAEIALRAAARARARSGIRQIG